MQSIGDTPKNFNNARSDYHRDNWNQPILDELRGH